MHLSQNPAKPASGEAGLLNEGKSSYQGQIFQRLTYEKDRIREKVLRQCFVNGVSFKATQLSDCDFFHTRFTDCYFKKASLTRVRFIDCFFERCDFDGAAFSSCGFEYSEFRDCRVDYEQIQDCLPQWQNVLFRLARSLRVNARSMGDYEEYRKFLSLELTASEMHYKFMFTKYGGYYKKYRPAERLKALWRWAAMKLDRLLWGHGEKWTRVLAVAGTVIIIFALVFRYAVGIANMPHGASIWNYVAFSASNFMTLPYDNAAPVGGLARFLQISEAGLGLIFFGLLVTSLYVRISKRC
jgi:hypothetical protein